MSPLQLATSAVEKILRQFPKDRPALPAPYRDIYAAQYKENRSGESTAASAAQKMERWLHRQVAQDIRDGRACSTLELGAGTLNQLPFEPNSEPYDIVEPFTELFRDSNLLPRVREVFADVREIPEGRRYDRITSVAVLEHIADLPVVLTRTARLLAPGGSFRAAIPAEGGLLWKMGWTFTTGLEFRIRHRLDYGVIMKHEHLNTAAEIEELIQSLYSETKTRSFGIGRQLSLYRFIEAKMPRLDVAQAWEDRFAI